MTQAGPPGLRGRRLLARAALGWELFWPGAWPVLAVLGVFLVLALLGLPASLPVWLHSLGLLAFAAALALVLRRAWQGRHMPDALAAERRLERASGLSHRPLSVMVDRPAGNDPMAMAIWQAHQARMAARIRNLRVGLPRPGLAARDPRALRAAMAVALVAAFGIAGDAAPERLRRALLPAFAKVPPPAALRIEAWVTPPAYTGAPPIFLSASGGQATVPAGSRMQVTLSGRPGTAPELSAPGGTITLRGLDASSFAADLPLTDAARLTLRRDGAVLAEWNLAVQADAPPRVSFPEPPARAQRGLAIRIPWQAEDDWGVQSLRVELRLTARPDAPPVTQTIPLPPGTPRQARGITAPDLTAHPWAGLAVRLRLAAEDGAGQVGVSEPVELLLPERSFSHPVAQALVTIRRDLSLAPEARDTARRALEQLATAPEAFENDATTALGLRVARNRLILRRPGAVEEAQELLWDMALALEEGRDGRTARALAQAQQALREALENAERQNQERENNDPARQEAERRIQELREAIRRHLEAMAERLQRENAESLSELPQNRADQREINRRTERLREANRENRIPDAQRELAELEEMLRNLQEGRQARGENPERQQQRQRGQQQMGVVQDMVRRQGEMLDRGQRRIEAEEARRNQQRRSQGAQNQRPPAQVEPQTADARRQRALRRALGELMQQYGDLTGEMPEALGRADQAMREAQEALGEGGDAREPQSRAMRHLQEGGRQMAQQIQRQFGQQSGQGEGEPDDADMAGNPEEGGEGEGEGREMGEGRDPLGRRARDVAGNADQGSDTRVPDEAEQMRTRRIQDELRRRGAERERAAEELDYIERLLRRF